jgi:hypothetical protein
MSRPADPLEAYIEEFLRKRVRLLGGYAFKFTPTIAGVPDRMVLMPGGRTYFVELKRAGEQPSAIQQVWHERLRGLGFEVVVLDSRDAVTEWLRRIVTETTSKKRGRPARR